VLADVAWRIERQRARQSLRLEFLYSEAIRAWRTSQEDALRRRQRKTDGAGGSTSTVAEVISENQHGDPRYLEEARRALADLRTLWGVDAPEQLSVDTTSPYAAMSDEAVAAELVRQTDLLKRFFPITLPPDATKENLA
jgi:hypothetical protein